MLNANRDLLKAREKELAVWEHLKKSEMSGRILEYEKHKKVIDKSMHLFKIINKIELDFQKHCKFNLGNYRHWANEFCKFCNYNGYKDNK